MPKTGLNQWQGCFMDNLMRGLILGGVVCLSAGIAHLSLYKMNSHLKKRNIHIDWLDRVNFTRLLKEYKYSCKTEDNSIGIWLIVFGLSVVSISVT